MYTPPGHCAAHPWLRPRGFALLELLLAMTVAAAVAAVLVVSLRIAFDARDAGDQEVGTMRSTDAALRQIDADLRGVLPPTGLLAQAFAGENGQGDASEISDAITFTTTNPMHPADRAMGELVRVRYALIDRTELGSSLLLADDTDDESDTSTAVRNRCLVRTVTTNLLATGETTQVQQVLVERVAAFEVQYSDGSEWLDEWDSFFRGDSLPTAVRVSLSRLPPGEAGFEDEQTEAFTLSRVTALPVAPSRSQRQEEAADG